MEIVENDPYQEYWQRVEFWEKNFTLPRDYRLATLDKLSDSDEKRILETYSVESDEFGFLLLGKSGVGKTFTLCAFLNRILWHCYSSKIKMTANVAFHQIGHLLFKLRNQDKAVFEECHKVKYLFLDDFGTENTTDFARDHFFTILDLRCQQKSPTFISSNLTLKEFQEKYGERIVSRLKEMCAILELKGNDKRVEIMKDRVMELKARVSN